MIVLELNQVEIDFCNSCESIWLDSGEIELLLNDLTDEDKVFSFLTVNAQVNEKKRKCPLCGKNMWKTKFFGDETVIIDKCKIGEGYWFDKDELQKVLSANLEISNPVITQIKNMFANKSK